MYVVFQLFKCSAIESSTSDGILLTGIILLSLVLFAYQVHLMFTVVAANTAERSHGLVVAIVLFNCLQLDLVHTFSFVFDRVWNFMLCRGDL